MHVKKLPLFLLSWIITAFSCLGTPAALAQESFKVASPDGHIEATVTLGEQLSYFIALDGERVLEPSPLALMLTGGETWGVRPQLLGSSTRPVKATISSPFYRKDQIEDNCNLLTLDFRGDWSVEFRAYDDGVAYRFVSRREKPFQIAAETAAFAFGADLTAIVPYVQVGKDGDYEAQFHSSFENQYTVAKLSALNRERLMFLPLVVDLGKGRKMLLSESDLDNYPGMYLSAAADGHTLTGRWAPVAKSEAQGGHNMLQMRVTAREPYIAKVDGICLFPWRFAVITTDDTQLAATDMTYKLAAPSRLADTSWIKPGKVAWDWWNDWNIEGVDFRAGINNATYKFYIDFAARNGIEYVILDEGWAVNLQADLMQVVPEIDIKELADYGRARGVGIVLWAGYHAFNRDMEKVCRHYAELGVKGFKVDFMDRDDQAMVAFMSRAAATAAKYKLFLDLHGMYKPAGLNRTYPNLLNFEGVFGLEQMKWSPPSVDQMAYDVSVPFIRQAAGPMDYTQGAMRNATRRSYRPDNSEPMSQGTRSHQLAMYVVYDSPFNMLCDAPTSYMREPESLAFIAAIPTVWDETRVLAGKLGEYIVTARRKGTTWYIGGMTSWTPRDLTLDLAFLGAGRRHVTIFQDGVNADRRATDYKKLEADYDGPLPARRIHLAPGGGFAAIITAR